MILMRYLSKFVYKSLKYISTRELRSSKVTERILQHFTFNTRLKRALSHDAMDVLDGRLIYSLPVRAAEYHVTMFASLYTQPT